MIWVQNATDEPIACPKRGCKQIDPGWEHYHGVATDEIREYRKEEVRR